MGLTSCFRPGRDMSDDTPTKKRKTSTLAANRDILNADENAMIDKLVECGQDHLFANWPAPGTDDDDKRRFLAQAAVCDAGGRSPQPPHPKKGLYTARRLWQITTRKCTVCSSRNPTGNEAAWS